MVLSIHAEQATIQAGQDTLDGVLWMPKDAAGIILFANSRGGYRVKPPIDYVGSVLRNARLGTLWLDLLTARESSSRNAPPATDILVQRLEAACNWLLEQETTRDMPVGLFGASNAAAAALQFAAARGQQLFATVLRATRMDLVANDSFGKVNTPTLLIVGSLDNGMLEANRAAYIALRCKKRLEIIPGATHSFEEPGSMEVVARLARGWFLQNMSARRM